MIQIQHMNKSFDGKPLFRDFDLEVADQEFVIISGKSGSGKTTLLNIIGGIEPVDSGRVIVGGTDITKEKICWTIFAIKWAFSFRTLL